MTITQIRQALRRQHLNLSHLSRLAKINLRTLHRIKSGDTATVLLSTAEAIERALATINKGTK